MTNPEYTEVARAHGAWSLDVTLPPTRTKHVCAVLEDLTTSTSTPITAWLYGDGVQPVTKLLLVRDPSRTHGTPDIAEYETLSQHMYAMTGWTISRARTRRYGILVGLGLREGYAPDAPCHSPSEIVHILGSQKGDWSCRRARLVSARAVDDAVRWYDEPAVVIHADAEMEPAITRLAGAFNQHRFVITDFTTDTTRALARSTP